MRQSFKIKYKCFKVFYKYDSREFCKKIIHVILKPILEGPNGLTKTVSSYGYITKALMLRSKKVCSRLP